MPGPDAGRGIALPARAPVRARAAGVPAAGRSDAVPRRAGASFARCRDEDVSPGAYVGHAERSRPRPLRWAPARPAARPRRTALPRRCRRNGPAPGRAGRSLCQVHDAPAGAWRHRLRGPGRAGAPAAARLAAARDSLQNRYRYILVDEFQDTNRAQSELVALLAERHRNVTVVGDDDQSIYRFRGAAISNILEFRDRYRAAADRRPPTELSLAGRRSSTTRTASSGSTIRTGSR